MSRIGKEPINIPAGATVKLTGANIEVKGPKGTLTRDLRTDLVNVNVENNVISVTIGEESLMAKSLWGLTRTLINNMVVGVTTGFNKNLEFNGVGYRAAVAGNKLNLNLGYSHPIEYELPNGVNANVVKNVIEISGCDKELVGFVAAKVRSFRKPEPYKGKGIKYVTETIIRKAGKTGSKK